MAPRIYVGRFDPRFLGVAIRAISESDADSFRHHDRSQPAQVSVLTQLDDDAVVADLSRQTVLEHEVRHFRDSLLFPFGARTTRSRLHASYNGFTVATTLIRLRGDANVLPVPLQVWLHLTADERDTFLARESALAGKILQPPPLPIIRTDDDLSELGGQVLSLDDDEEILLQACRSTLLDYRLIESLWRSPYAEGEDLVSPAIDMWEAAGLLCQLAAIERYAGERLMQRFLGWVERRGPQSYRRALGVLGFCREKLDWRPTMRNYLTLITWSQMGRYETEKSESSPGHRLGMLVAAAGRHARWSEDSAFEDLITEWDTVAGTDSIDALRSATERFDEFSRKFEQTKAMPLLDGGFLSAIADARRQMLAAFLADPDAYVDPVTYLADETRYPLPCVGLEHQTGTLGSDLTDVTPANWSPIISFAAALRLVGLALVSDAIFLPGEKSLQPNGRQAIAHTLKLQAVRIIDS